MIKQQEAGFHNGYKLWTVTAANSKGAQVTFTNYGAAIMSVMVPDKEGSLGDVVLGYDDVQGFIEGTASQGAVVGRFANRISKGEFELNGVHYTLFKNDGENTLHGGSVGYNKRVWELIAADYDPNSGENHVVFGYTSPDGEENFPGTVAITVDYCFDERNRLSITYDAESDTDTILNLTNHSYFNLSEGDVMGTQLKIYADKYTPVDEGLIPTGEIKSVKGTPFDFTELRSIKSKDIEGYDHNFILRGKKEESDEEDLPPIAAYAWDKKSGRTLTCYTDMPALQLYTANGLKETGKGGKEVLPQTGFCLETQFCPDSPNKPMFPSCVLKKGKLYHKVTVYEFGVFEE